MAGEGNTMIFGVSPTQTIPSFSDFHRNFLIYDFHIKFWILRSSGPQERFTKPFATRRGGTGQRWHHTWEGTRTNIEHQHVEFPSPPLETPPERDPPLRDTKYTKFLPDPGWEGREEDAETTRWAKNWQHFIDLAHKSSRGLQEGLIYRPDKSSPMKYLHSWQPHNQKFCRRGISAAFFRMGKTAEREGW